MSISQKLIIVAIGLVLGTLVMKLWLFDACLKFALRDQTSLRTRNEVRGIYLKIPFPLDFKVYFFNVSNPMDIQNGAKPIVKEIGPYWYDEFKEKIDVVDNDMEDSLTYTPYDIFKFNQNKSGSLMEDDYVTILNPLLVGMVSQVAQDTPVFLSIVNQSINQLFFRPKSIFLTVKVKDILFDGAEINCKTKDFAANAICSQLKTKIPGIKFKEGDEKIYLFSLLGSRNATTTRRVKVLRGIEESKDLGKLVEVDGEKELTIWSTKECNRFEGTDGWIFPPLLTPEEGLKSFSVDLCSFRNVKVNYINDTIAKNINVRIYESDLGDQTTNEADKCYCRTPDTCLKKGVFDLSKCMGVPILATLPHFLHTDDSYLSEIDGLQPDVDKHSLRVFFEPMTGSPIQAAKRLQFNFNLQPNKKVFLFANLPTALFPLVWVEESVDLEGDLLKKLQGIFLLLKLVDPSMYVLLAFGVICFAVGIFYHYKNQKSVSITPVYEIKKQEDHENNDMENLTRRRQIKDKMGHANPVMSGHEFDKY